MNRNHDIEPFDFFLELKDREQNSVYLEKYEIEIDKISIGDELELFSIDEGGDEVYIYRRVKNLVEENPIEVLANWGIEMINPVLVVFFGVK